MRRRQRSIYLHLGIGLALAISAIVLVAGWAAQRQDKSSLIAQRDVVKYETGHLFAALRGKLQPQIYWQEAFDKSVLAWDPKWVAYQFGTYLDSQGINGILIFDEDGRLKHVYSHGMKEPIEASQIADASGLTVLRALATDVAPSMPPVLKQGMVEIGGRAFFAAAGQIVPENEKDLKRHFDKRVAVFLVEASKKSYSTLTESFDITDLNVGRTPSHKGLSSVPLNDASGKPIVYVWWKPQEPGNDFLSVVIPLTLLVFIALALMQGAIVRRWQSLQQALFSAEAKREAAEDESRAKSIFLGTISHELRTPLNAILGFSEILARSIFGPLGSPRYEAYVADIQKSGQALLTIVDDLLEVARFDAQDRKLPCETIDIGKIAKDTVQEHRGSALDKDITLTIDIAEALLAEGNDKALAQIIARVLSNAIKFGTPNSTTVHVSATRRANGCEIVVSDNGIGISDEMMNRIYQPFVQAEGHLTRRHGGMGLGLPMARALSRAMGAELAISSKLGHGTLVSITLPTPTKSASVQSAPKAA